MSKKKNQELDEKQKIVIEKCCRYLSISDLCEILNISENLVKDYYDKANKKLDLKFDEKNGSVSMTQAQSMKDDQIKHTEANIFNSPKYKGCIHKTEQ